MTPRPATQNQRDCAVALTKIEQALGALNKAWTLIRQVELRERAQHGSTGRTDKSVAKSRRRKR